MERLARLCKCVCDCVCVCVGVKLRSTLQCSPYLSTRPSFRAPSACDTQLPVGSLCFVIEQHLHAQTQTHRHTDTHTLSALLLFVPLSPALRYFLRYPHSRFPSKISLSLFLSLFPCAFSLFLSLSLLFLSNFFLSLFSLISPLFSLLLSLSTLSPYLFSSLSRTLRILFPSRTKELVSFSTFVASVVLVSAKLRSAPSSS